MEWLEWTHFFWMGFFLSTQDTTRQHPYINFLEGGAFFLWTQETGFRPAMLDSLPRILQRSNGLHGTALVLNSYFTFKAFKFSGHFLCPNYLWGGLENDTHISWSKVWVTIGSELWHRVKPAKEYLHCQTGHVSSIRSSRFYTSHCDLLHPCYVLCVWIGLCSQSWRVSCTCSASGLC